MSEIGKRLALLRKQKGFTQQKLATAIGVTQRVITYFEREATSIPADKLADIARVLDISTDEILGLKTPKKKQGAPQNSYLRRKLAVVESFKKKDQKTIISMIDAIETAYKK